jgi:hypothetical protein
MAQEASEENFFLFGLTAEQVAASRGSCNPQWHYDNEPETRAVLDLIFSDHFSRYEPGVFTPIRDALLTQGDFYMHLADLGSYLDADQRLRELYADPHAWARKAILNVAGAGKFSSDRTIAEYAADIWKVESCPRGSGLSWFRLSLSKDTKDDYISTRWQAGCQGNARRSDEAGARVLRVPARPDKPEPVRKLWHKWTSRLAGPEPRTFIRFTRRVLRTRRTWKRF